MWRYVALNYRKKRKNKKVRKALPTKEHKSETRYNETNLDVLNDSQDDKHISSCDEIQPEISCKTARNNNLPNDKQSPLEEIQPKIYIIDETTQASNFPKSVPSINHSLPTSNSTSAEIEEISHSDSISSVDNYSLPTSNLTSSEKEGISHPDNVSSINNLSSRTSNSTSAGKEEIPHQENASSINNSLPNSNPPLARTEEISHPDNASSINNSLRNSNPPLAGTEGISHPDNVSSMNNHSSPTSNPSGGTESIFHKSVAKSKHKVFFVKIVPRQNGETLLKTVIESNVKESNSNYKVFEFSQKIYSTNRKEFIERKVTNRQLSYSCKFIEKLPETEMIIRVHGSENLLTLNKDNFIAKIRFTNGYILDTSASFENMKSRLLNEIAITKILEDEFLDKRDRIYDQFKTLVLARVNSSAENIDCAEDLLQLSTIRDHIFKKNCLKNKVILKEIIQNDYISTCVKQMAQELINSEIDLHNRNKYLPKFRETALPYIKDLSIVINDFYKSGILNHKNSLKKFPPKFKHLLNLIQIDYLPPIILLSLNSKDIKLFLDLITNVRQQNGIINALIPEEYILSIWNNFYAKVIQLTNYQSIRQLGPLTNSIYFFLFKSFCEIMAEICSVTNVPCSDLFVNKNGKFSIAKSINWPKETPMNKALDVQCRLIFKLMEHYEPGKYSKGNSYKYTWQLKNHEKTFWNLFPKTVKSKESISENRLPWLYILDCGLAQISNDKANNNSEKFKQSLITFFAKYLEKCVHDKHESFRIAVHNITKLASHICSYISTSSYEENEIDQSILDRQTILISNILNTEGDDAVINHFANLVDVYRIYWENREFIFREILKTYKEFENSIKENILLPLLKIMDKALRINATIRTVVHFFRMFNEFLEHFKGIKLEWLVSAKSFCNSLSGILEELIGSKVKCYRVKNPEKLVEVLKANKADVPEHYMIKVIGELLCIINESLDKENWSGGDRLIAAGDLFLAIGHSLSHFSDQSSYIDFDNFFRDCTSPFSDVLKNSQTYSEFKARLANVENYYLYTNKQNEISIEEALKLYKEMCNINSIKNFDINFDASVLKDCYSRYDNKLTSLKNCYATSDIKSVIVDLHENLKDNLPIDKWTPDFKQNVIPSLLAYLSTIWSILESKDLARIGKRIELHIIQVLCIFRLLGVDKNTNGVDKHLAQVLTGQGKSIILGLLSALLAITGNECVIACYSEYLAKRDKNSFSKFFDTLAEFRVKNKIAYCTIDEAVNDFLYLNINGVKTSIRNLVSDLILNKLPSKINASSKKSKSRILLIDEVDLFFSPNFCGYFYLPVTSVSIPALLEIQPKIWDIVEDGVDDVSIILERIQEFINELLKDTKYEDFDVFLEHTNEFFKSHLEKMIRAAIKIYESKKNNSLDKRYKINNEGFISFRNEYGIYVTNIINGYENIFNYFVLKDDEYDSKNYKNFGYLLIGCGSFSYSDLPKEFSNILGVSGTLTTLHGFEKALIKSYGINAMSVMPSFFGKAEDLEIQGKDISYISFRRLKFKPRSDCMLTQKEPEWLDKIHDSVCNKVLDGRAVIVFFDTEREMNLFDEKYRSRIDRLHKLTGNEEPSTIEWYINESGVSKTVTLAIRSMGRGVDFKANDLSVEKKGGVHVIQTFFSPFLNEEVQLQGRTARKDNTGSYELILCFQHLDNIGCSRTANDKLVSSYRELCDVRENIANSRGVEMEKRIKESAEKSDLSMKFLRSFGSYTLSKRKEYFSQYPLKELNK